MDKMGYPVLTEKTIRLLEKNQYSFNVSAQSDKAEIKKWIELFFGVKVGSINTHALPNKKKKIGTITGYTVRYKRIIITLKSGYSIPLFSSK
uniref:Large ribosomal subunit protein uL23c n=1 Tax=Plagiochila chinensis TaxID=2575588 RepID=A0A4Y5P6Q0_9MARC|nr:ribosomal protein L23 [Plagiochila chinensis]QCW58962.1 ribosomal protein L23 [Plagiochila chinensis]